MIDKNLRWEIIKINGKYTNYAISENGDVYNRSTGNELRPIYDKHGYLVYKLYINGKYKNMFAHRLVAQAFIPNPENKPQVNHINGIKDCNVVENLEWVTNQENVDHAWKTGLTDNRGEKNGGNVYSEAQIRKACELFTNPANRPCYISIAVGIPSEYLYQIRTGKRWGHIIKEYNFPNIDYRIYHDCSTRKYTEEQIHEVCRLLQDKGDILSQKDISKLTGVPSITVSEIYCRLYWNEISQFYIFKERPEKIKVDKFKKLYIDNQIRYVCSLLENPFLEISHISKLSGITYGTTYGIYERKQWTDISKNYIIPERIKDKMHLISKLHTLGVNFNLLCDVIAEIFNMSNDDKFKSYIQEYIACIENRIKPYDSTTI